MVLGFGRGPERFPTAKEQTPGPGAYDPKDLETKLPPKSGFLTGERFSSQELEGNITTERQEPSPPREKKPINTGNDRSYSWATQRIHELNKELDAANKRIKELDKHLKDRTGASDKAKKDLAAALDHKDQLQARLSEQEQELAIVKGELSTTKDQLSQASAREAKASKSAQVGAARIEQLLLELQQAAEIRKQLEQQCSAFQKDAENGRQEAEAAISEFSSLKRQLEGASAERAELCNRVTDLGEQCRQQAAALNEQTAKRAEAETQAEAVTCSLAVMRTELLQTLNTLSEVKAKAARSSGLVERLQIELAEAQTHSSQRGEQLTAVQTELEAAAQEKEALLSQISAKEAYLESLNNQTAARIAALVINVDKLTGELAAAQEGVKQRDESIASFTARIDELVQQLSDQKARLNTELQQRHTELEAAGLREQALMASNAQLEQRLARSVALCNQHTETTVSLQTQLDAVRAELAVQVETTASTATKLEAAETIIGQQGHQLQQRASQVLELEGRVAALTASAEEQSHSLRERDASIDRLRQLLSSNEAEVGRLNQQLASEQAQLLSRVQEASVLTHTLANRDAMVASLQSQVVQLQTNVSDRDGQLAIKASEMQQLTTVASGLEATLADARATLAERDAMISSLTNELGDVKAGLEAAADAASATSELVATLEDSLSKVKGDAIALKHRVAELEALNDKLDGDLGEQRVASASLSAELAAVKLAADAGAAREVALREQLTLAGVQLTAAEGARQQLQQQSSQLDRQLAAAREDQASLSRSHYELLQREADLSLQLQERCEAIASHEREVIALRASNTEVQGELMAKVAALGAAQQEALELLTRLQGAQHAAESQAAQLAQTQSELTSRSTMVDELRCALASMEQKMVDMAALKDQLALSLSCAHEELSNTNTRWGEVEGRAAQLEASLAEAAQQRAQLQAALVELRAEKQAICSNAEADTEKARVRLAALECELQDSRNKLGAEIEQLITDLEAREREIKELKVTRHETSSALTAVTAERADLHSQLEDLRRREMDTQAELVTARARADQMDAEAQSLQALAASALEETQHYREEALATGDELDKALGEIRTLKLQEGIMEGLRQEVDTAYTRLRDAEARNEALQAKVASMESRVASMTPICSRAKLDEQVRALSDALEKSHLRSGELEEQVRRNMLLGTSATLELRRLTDENEHLVKRMMKLEDDLKEQAALGHNNHKQKIQYHLRLKQELEELRHECTVLLRDKFQLEQCIRYLAVQVGMGPDDRRQSLPTAERKAIEKVLPACLAYNAMYSTPLSQRAMKLCARGKNNEQGTVYAGGKGTFEEAINEARTKTLHVAANAVSDMQFVAAAVIPSIADVRDDDSGAANVDSTATRSDTCGSPDGKAARGAGGNQSGGAYGTPLATIRGAGTPVSGASQGQTLSKLEERIKLLISDVCAPATARNPVGPPAGGPGAADLVAPTPAISTITMQGGGGMRDRDQDKSYGGAQGGNGGGAVGSNGGAGGGVGGAGGPRERAPRPSMAGDTMAGRGLAGQSRRLTTAPSAKMAFKS